MPREQAAQRLLLRILFVTLVMFACGPDQNSETTTSAGQEVDFTRLGAVEQELKEWGEGRWKMVQVNYQADEDPLVLWKITVVDYPDVNAVATKSYCKIIGDEMRKSLPGIRWEAEIEQRGRLLKRCP